MKLLILIFFLLIAQSSLAVEFILKTALSPAQQIQYQKAKQIIFEKLPNSFQILGKMNIRFKNLPPIHQDMNAGNTDRRQNLNLSFDLLNESNFSLLVSTLIHEMAHQYDFKYNISNSKIFQLKIGWNKNSSAYTFRSVDKYEQHSPGENFAVNVEHFLLDSNFKCRKPTLHAYLVSALQTNPFPEVTCPSVYPYVNQDILDVTANTLLKTIDINRIYQIHYLFASKGKRAMSRWGHAMLRLVICDPKRTVVDSKCLEDIDHHLVVSPAALINEMEMSPIKGLTGKYGVRYFITRLYSITQQYNAMELRDLESYPLLISEDEKRDLSLRLLENHWTYNGKYKFMSNNCSDEIWKTIQSALDPTRTVDINITSPNGLKKVLANLELIDPSSPSSPEALENGLVFKSYLHKYNLALKNLEPWIGKVPLKEWLKQAAKVREDTILNIVKQNPSKYIIASLFILESKVLLDHMKNAMIDIQKEWIGQKKIKKNNPDHPLNDLTQLMELISTPSNLGQSGYGLPFEIYLENQHIKNFAEQQLGYMANLNKMFGETKDSNTHISGTRNSKKMDSQDAIIINKKLMTILKTKLVNTLETKEQK